MESTFAFHLSWSDAPRPENYCFISFVWLLQVKSGLVTFCWSEIQSLPLYKRNDSSTLEIGGDNGELGSTYPI